MLDVPDPKAFLLSEAHGRILIIIGDWYRGLHPRSQIREFAIDRSMAREVRRSKIRGGATELRRRALYVRAQKPE